MRVARREGQSGWGEHAVPFTLTKVTRTQRIARNGVKKARSAIAVIANAVDASTAMET